MEHEEKVTRNVSPTEYIIVTGDDGKEYSFTKKGDAYTPTTTGATDKENDYAGLTKACEYLESQGYTITVGRMAPAGFEY